MDVSVSKTDISLPLASDTCIGSYTGSTEWSKNTWRETQLILKGIAEHFLEELTFYLRPKVLVKLARQSFAGRIKMLQAKGRAHP